jgi:hypothetical protein
MITAPTDARRRPPVQILLRGDAPSFAACLLPLKEPFEKATGVKLSLVAQLTPLSGIIEMDSGGADGMVVTTSLETLRNQLASRGVVLANRGMVQQYPILEEKVSYKVIVNPKNQIGAIKAKHLRKIYSGKYRTWDDLDGPNVPIQVVWGRWSTGTAWMLNSLIMEDEAIREDTLQVEGLGEILAKVAENPDAIAIVPSHAVTDKVKVLEAPELAIEGPFRMVTISVPTGNMFKFLDFVKGEGRKYLGY